jgi:signal transduction histidine kinase
MRRSIRVRVLASLLAVVVPLLAASAWFLARAFEQRLLRDIDVALQEEAETIAGLMGAGLTEESLRLVVVAIAAESDLGTPKQVAVLRGERAIAEAPPGAARRLAEPAAGFHVARYRSTAVAEPVDVVIAVSASQPLLAHRRLTWLLWVGTPLVSLLLGATIWVSVGRALRPLERAADGLTRIEAASLSSRLPQEDSDDEVGRIVRAANEMLDRVELAVGRLQRFTADAAHELRTPLTVLRTGLELAVSKQRTAEESRAALCDALQQTDRIRRLAEDLLTLARLDARGGSLDESDVDVAELLDEVADGWTEEAQARGMRLAVDTERPMLVAGNGTDLYRLFNNLIENAIRHGVTGAEIRVHAARRDGAVRVDVADDGPGIGSEDLERVFDRFYRGRRAGDSPGSGLGLSIAQQIARQHGGRISARRREDGLSGSVFVVSLPDRGKCS